MELLKHFGNYYGLNLQAYSSVLSICGDQSSFVQPCLSQDWLNPRVKAALHEWNSLSLGEFPSDWTTLYQNDIIPSETFLLNIINSHVSTTSRREFGVDVSLKHTMLSLVKFTNELVR